MNKEKLKTFSDDELINSRICPICLKENDKIIRLTPGGSCFDCHECGFSVCE